MHICQMTSLVGVTLTEGPLWAEWGEQEAREGLEDGGADAPPP